MKFYIFILLFVAIFSEHHYASAIGTIDITKVLYSRDKNKTIFLDNISKLDIPDEAKEWVKKVNYMGKELKSNIDLIYNRTIGGNAIGEIFYYYKDYPYYTFIYGNANVELRPLRKYLKGICTRPMPILPRKCKYYYEEPSYVETTFKEYVGERIRNKILGEIKFKK